MNEGVRWVDIPGWKYRYRINDCGVVQRKLPSGKWYTYKPGLYNARATIQFHTKEGKRMNVAVVNLMADAFMGGRRPGMYITHKNGLRMDNNLQNLQFIPARKSGTLYGGQSRRKPVKKIDRYGKTVAIYRSIKEAAEKNFVGHSTVQTRCARVANREKEFELLGGYSFRYDE